MAETVILLATEKLDRLLVEKAGSLQGTEKQVKWLKDNLRMSLSLLKDSVRDHHLMSRVREIAHDADITIDTFISKVENSTRRGGKLRWPVAFLEKLHPLNNFRKEIESILSRIREVTDTYRMYNYRLEGARRSGSVGPHGSVPGIRESDVVGLEGDVKLLLNEATTDGLSTLCILGMGGIGKTTLASVLYNHADVARKFELRAWVHVSGEFSQKEVLMQLIPQVRMEVQPEMMTWNRFQLQEKVFQHLKGRTYFIVLDDVWRSSDLEFVLAALPRQDSASILLITSRNRNIIRRSEYIHEMEILDPDKSWQLFLKKVFTSDHKCPKHLEKIGREIVTKCDGLPLAIEEAGKQLAEKTQSKSVWENFLESMDLSVTSATLELSYNRLPPRLKSCFLRLGFFKEGTTIRVDKLVQVGVSGGMVSREEEENEMDEEIGRKDLDELISQYLVQVKDMTREGRVKYCYINYNLHRLAITKAKEEIRFEVVLSKEGNHRSPHKPRHRAICCNRERFNYSTNQDEHLVSLFFHGGGNFDASPSYWKNLQLLKILDWEGFGLKSLSRMVETLISLKYLGLRNNYIQELPRSLGRLKSLEVLDIALNFMVEVPNMIREMDSLRHLYMSDIICRKPLKIDGLKNLQTLAYISVDNWTYELSGLKMMTSLQKLGIEELDGKSNISKLFNSLAELKKLDCLTLRGFRFRSMPSLNELGILHGLTQLKLDGLLTRLPSANNFPPNIKYLSLVNSCLDEDPMPILKKLSKLFYLKLRNAFMGEEMVISSDGFAELHVLCIEELWHLRRVQVGEGAMRRLRQLEIKSCPYLKTLPEEIGLMSNLEQLKMVTTKNIAAIIRESSFISKIRHVDIQP